MKQYQEQIGQWVQWFRYNPYATTSNPIYDTGPQRVWYPSVTLPVHLGEYQRARKNYDDDGLYLIDQAHLIFSWWAFFSTGIPDPDPSGQDHVNDRVGFDSHLFKVSSFYPQGRVADYFMTVSVDLTELSQEEMAEDVPSPMFDGYHVAS